MPNMEKKGVENKTENQENKTEKKEEGQVFSGSIEEAEKFLKQQQYNNNKKRKNNKNEKNEEKKEKKTLTQMIKDFNHKKSEDDSDEDAVDNDDENVDNGGLAKDVKKFDLADDDDSDEFDLVKKQKVSQSSHRTDNIDTLKFRKRELEHHKMVLENKIGKFSENGNFFILNFFVYYLF